MATNQSLFREPALQHQNTRLRGELLVIQPLRYGALLSLLLGLVVCAGLYLAWGTYARKEAVRGYLTPDRGVVKVVATQPSTVVERRVHEGQLVQEGEVLFALAPARVNSQGAPVHAQVLAALQEQRRILEAGVPRARRMAELEQHRLHARQRQLFQEIAAMESLVRLRSERLQLSRESLDVTQAPLAIEQGIYSKDEIRARRALLLEQTLQAEQLQVSLLAKRAELQNVDFELAQLPLDQQAATAQLQQSISQLDVTFGAEERVAIVAPVSGTVTAVQAVVGETVAMPAPLCVIVPRDAHLQAQVFIPTRAAGWVRAGQDVSLMYDAFPYEHYGAQSATVVSVSESILNPSEVDAPVALEEPVYEARLQLTSDRLQAFGKSHALQPGMLLTAHVTLERRTLLQWLLRPLYALRQG